MEIVEGISMIPIKNNQIIFEENLKKMNFDNIFDFHLQSSTKSSQNSEEQQISGLMQTITMNKKKRPLKMQENLMNLENYFQTHDKILENKIYSRLIPMIISFITTIGKINIFCIYDNLKNIKEIPTKKLLESHNLFEYILSSFI